MDNYHDLLLNKAQRLYNRATKANNVVKMLLLKAAKIYQIVLKKYPSNPVALEHLGITLATLAEATKNKAIKEQWYRKALLPINKAIHTKSKHSIHSKRIKWHILNALGKQQTKEYYQYLDLILKEEPKNGVALSIKANWLMNHEQYRSAIKFWKMLLQTHTCSKGQRCEQKKDILNSIGLCWQCLKETRKAINYFDSALKIDRHDFDAIYHKTITLYQAKKYLEALKVAKRILKHKVSREQRIDVLRISLSCLLSLKEIQKTKKLFENLMEIDRGNKNRYHNLKRKFLP